MAAAVVVEIKGKDTTAKATKSAKSNFEKLGDSVKKSALAQIASIGGIALALAKSIQSFTNFDTRIREISTLLGNVTDQELTDMGNKVQDLAVEFGQSIDTMATANYDAISAGFTDAADSTLLLRNAATLAVGGVSDIQKTTDLLTSSLNSYGASAKEAEDFSNVLFTTVRLGKTNINQLASSLGDVTAITKTAGLRFEDLGSLMATLTAGGIKTSQATTAVASAMVQLSAPAAGAASEMKKLGISLVKTDDGTIDLLKTIEQFRGLDLNTIRRLIPDIEGAKAILTAASNFDVLSKNMQQMSERTGAAGTALEKMSEGVGFRMAQMRARAEVAFIKIGEAMLPLIEIVLDIIDTFANMPPIVQQVTVAIGALGAAVITLIPFVGPAGALVLGLTAGAVALGLWASSSGSAESQSRKTLTQFEGLTGALIKLNEKQTLTNDETKRREQIINTLNTQFPDFLGNLDAELATTEELRKQIFKVNQEFEKRITLRASEQQLAEQQQRLVEIQKNLNNAIVEQATIEEQLRKTQAIRVDEFSSAPSQIREAEKRAALDFLQSIDRVGNLTLQSRASQINAAIEQSGEFLNFRKQQFDQEVISLQQSLDTGRELYDNFFNHLKTQSESALGSTIDPNAGGGVPTIPGAGANVPALPDLTTNFEEMDTELLESPAKVFEESWVNAISNQAELFNNARDLELELFGTTEQQQIASLQRRFEAVSTFWKSDAELAALFEQKKEQIQMQSMKRIADAEREQITNKVQLLGNAFGMIANALGRQSAVAKAFLVAQATADTFAGANRALGAYPPPFSFIMAAAVTAAGLANVSKIVGMQAGGIVSASDALAASQLRLVSNRGTDSVPALLTPGEAVIPRQSVQQNPTAVRDLISGRNTERGGGSSANVTVNNNISITSPDTGGVRDFVNSASFRNAVSRAINDGILKLKVGGVDVEAAL